MEHWTEFFKSKPPREVEDSGITIASTTDSQSALNAATERARSEQDTSILYTEVGRGITEADGGTEHSQARTWVNGQPVGPQPAGPDVPPLPEMPTDYTNQIQAARQVLPDFDETLSDSVAIPAVVADTVRQLPNGAMVAYHLGKHRSEIDKLWNLSDGQVRRRIIDLSLKLRLNPVGVEPDALPYRAYRRLRDGRK